MNMYQQLTEPFPQEMERSLNKGGANLVYIPISEVINRLNKVLGVDKWSYSVNNWQQLGNAIVAHVTVTASIDGNTVSRDGVGGQKIKMTKQGEPLDIGDEVKGAVSDALKKAVQTLGIGLYLARSEDAMEIEQVIEAAANVDPEAEKIWNEFVSISKKLNAEQRDALSAFWSSYSGNSPKPKSPSDVNLADLKALQAEAVRLSFGGEYVVIGN
jgi:recombination DNA repair RAD52 pathway protein